MSQGSTKKGGPAAAELASRVGADEALASLINQFSDPLSFLRELVQNSLDAAATRVDVEFSFEAAAGAEQPGLMTIAITDNGEGMTERIIDDYLLTLFRSTKEDDLTKIGKFGVGFVSIFAMQPHLVLLETGQAGESWRVLFHPDARFEKMRMEFPFEGTHICLHKQVTEKEFQRVRKAGQQTVRYWCKYAEAEIVADGQDVSEPFCVDAALAVTHREPGTELVLGFAPPHNKGQDEQATTTTLTPLYGFYNRGLTLVEGSELPGEAAARLLEGLSFRVKSRYLEHTLTRDNVRQDEHYEKVITLVRRQVTDVLRPALVQYLCALTRGRSPQGAGGPPYRRGLQYARLPSMRLHQTCDQAPLFPTVDGGAVSFRRLRKLSPLLCAAGTGPVTRLLAAHKTTVVHARDGVLQHLKLCGLAPRDANQVYFTAISVEQDDTARALLAETDQLLDHVWARVSHLRLGDLDYAGSSVKGRLFVRQGKPFALSRHGKDRPRLLGGARVGVLNVHHPLVRSCLQLAATDLQLAALLLAQAMGATEQISLARALKMTSRSLKRSRTAEPAPAGS